MSYYSDMIKNAKDIIDAHELSAYQCEAIYRKVEFEYMMEDCRMHMGEEEVDWTYYKDTFGIDIEEVYDSDDEISKIIELYIDKFADCNIAENDSWNEAIKYYLSTKH